MQRQPPSHVRPEYGSLAVSQQTVASIAIPGANPSQDRPPVGRKAVPVRKPAGTTNATATATPSVAPVNFPVQSAQSGAPRPGNINTMISAISRIPHPTNRGQVQPVQELPAGWSSSFDADGRVYYIDHVTKQTSWNPPIYTPPALPLEWEERTNPDGRVYYFSHQTQASSWVRPRDDHERRRSSAISPGTSIRHGSMSTATSEPTSSNPSVQ